MSKPQKLAQVLSELITRRGYARVQATASYDEAWRTAVGPALAAFTRVGAVKRGVIEAMVANSTMLQEVTYQKRNILRELGRLLPDEKIVDVRLRVGAIE
jgi:predicted nucleic acid-binding Zn ribbon protein